MYAYGIRDNAFKLLKSNFTGRTQYVIYDVVKSDNIPIKCGVLQGSILGPLLFICSMNDIGNISDFLYTILYADDTSVLLSGKVYAHLIELLNTELEKVSIWLKATSCSQMLRKPTTFCFIDPESKLTLMLSSPWLRFVSKELLVLNTLG